ncbi:BRO family protein [Leuconostoc lactis]|uniref:BRO family protein n=1 Tax=Leuconostoc lactis TaxID=1246 RepID=UPI0024ADE93C|nr:BRO family protein [Leuconostoc lactis]MDI6495496.1 BRO family protein [Leuconostoc lactis]
MSLEVQVFDNLKVKEENGQVLFDAETAAIGLGLSTVAKSGNVVVRWSRVNKYLFSTDGESVKRGDFITEPQFYKLAIKANNETAEKFQDWVTSEVLPAIRRTGGYGIDRSNMTDVLVQAISSMNYRLHVLESVTITSSQEKALNNIKRQRIIWVIGGTYRYKQLSRVISKAILRDLFITYGISRLDDLKSKYFDDAYEFIKNWEPDENTAKKSGYAVFKRIRESYGSFNQWS